MLRERRRNANNKPNRRLDRKSSRGMIYENEELRIRTININAEVERGQSDIRKLRKENEQLRREIWALRDEYDKLDELLRQKDGNFLPSQDKDSTTVSMNKLLKEPAVDVITKLMEEKLDKCQKCKDKHSENSNRGVAKRKGSKCCDEGSHHFALCRRESSKIKEHLENQNHNANSYENYNLLIELESSIPSLKQFEDLWDDEDSPNEERDYRGESTSDQLRISENRLHSRNYPIHFNTNGPDIHMGEGKGPDRRFETGGNLEDLLHDIQRETSTMYLIDEGVDEECNSSKPFRSELKLVLVDPDECNQTQRVSSDIPLSVTGQEVTSSPEVAAHSPKSIDKVEKKLSIQSQAEIQTSSNQKIECVEPIKPTEIKIKQWPAKPKISNSSFSKKPIPWFGCWGNSCL